MICVYRETSAALCCGHGAGGAGAGGHAGRIRRVPVWRPGLLQRVSLLYCTCIFMRSSAKHPPAVCKSQRALKQAVTSTWQACIARASGQMCNESRDEAFRSKCCPITCVSLEAEISACCAGAAEGAPGETATAAEAGALAEAPGVALRLHRMAAGEEVLIGVPEAGAGKVASEAEAEAGKVALEAEAAFRAEAAPEAGVVLEGRAGDGEEDDQAIAEQLHL